MRLAVFASGTGSLFKAMIEQNVPVSLLLADRKCKAVEIAHEADIPTCLLRRSFGPDFDRNEYTHNVIDALQRESIDLVAMAGFMTILSAEMFEPDRYQMRVLNTHPSLLPAFKGDHAVRDALAYGAKVTGCTIHWATEEMDAGPILVQEPVAILPGDTVESLHERIKQVERMVYPRLLLGLLS